MDVVKLFSGDTWTLGIRDCASRGTGDEAGGTGCVGVGLGSELQKIEPKKNEQIKITYLPVKLYMALIYSCYYFNE